MDCRTSLIMAVCLALAGTVGCVTPNNGVQRGVAAPLPAPAAPITPPPTPPQSLTAANPNVSPALSQHQAKTPAEKTKSKIHILMAQATLFMAQAREEKIDLRQNDKWDEVRKTYQEVLKLDAKYLPAYQGLTQVYLKMGQKDQALDTINHALKLAPRDPNLLYDQANCHLCRREWKEAQNSLFRALEVDSENRQFKKTLGFALARSGQFDQAFEYLAQAYSVPGYAHYMVARMLAWPLEGQEENCKQHLRLALRDNPNLEEAREMLAEMERPAPQGPPTQLQAPVEGVARSVFSE